MALPTTGPISLSQVNVELGFSAADLITLNDAAVRNLAGVPSGTISMQDLLGKANVFAFTIAANQTNANLRTLAVNAGWNQSAALQATINSGVVITANSTAARALTVSGSFPNGVTLINNGTIVGRGGDGGNGGFGGTKSESNAGFPGASGGGALNVAVALTLQNNGTIAGGGGGGGGAGGRTDDRTSGSRRVGGGGGGGGRSSLTNSAGGLGGGTTNEGTGSAGGAGTLSSAGAGGASSTSSAGFTNGPGGNGGNWGAGGGDGAAALSDPDGGVVAAGGAAGAAVIGNSNITYTATGTRLGPIT